MTLDGDVDFEPKTLWLLMDRMKKNSMVGAACGRIHPIGSGPMVWYQKFEYAVGHWLQKATEHVFGCVLCCPGCFSLFRASALVDDNVLKTYTKEPEEGYHLVQYEQGEDRWLCTLLLKCGYKIDYCAGADAKTFAPESFFEFFIQRRRWSPSTIANMIDLVLSWRELVKSNKEISNFFMFYQCLVVGTSLLAPATVVTMISGSFGTVLLINPWLAFIVALTPVIIFGISCFICSQDKQLFLAGVFSTIYSFIMVIVTIGMILIIVSDSVVSPNILFVAFVAGVFILTGFAHPRELSCLVAGLLYYVTVPSTFIFLTVFFVCNLNDVSWGTREKKVVANHVENEKSILTLIKEIFKYFLKDKLLQKDEEQAADENNVTERYRKPILRVGQERRYNEQYWLKQLPGYSLIALDPVERKFWDITIEKHLRPLQDDKSKKERFRVELIELRNKCMYGFLVLNLMLALALEQLQISRAQLKGFYIGGKYEPVSVIFLSMFASILFIQVLGMLKHRWGTFLHLISSTELTSPIQENYDVIATDVIGYDNETQYVYDSDEEPAADYSDSDDGDDAVSTVSTINNNNIYRQYMQRTMCHRVNTCRKGRRTSLTNLFTGHNKPPTIRFNPRRNYTSGNSQV